jgi:VanZ family protein
MLLIFAASSIPKTQMPNFDVWDWLVKKTGHALGYGLLAAACLHGLTFDGRALTRRHLWGTLAFCALYAVSDEFHQRFVPGRGATPVDVGIDLLGSTLGMGVWQYARRRITRAVP